MTTRTTTRKHATAVCTLLITRRMNGTVEFAVFFASMPEERAEPHPMRAERCGEARRRAFFTERPHLAGATVRGSMRRCLRGWQATVETVNGWALQTSGVDFAFGRTQQRAAENASVRVGNVLNGGCFQHGKPVTARLVEG